MTNAIFTAISCNDLKKVQELIDDGVDINCRGEYLTTPLMLAVTKNRPDIVNYLIKNGADPYLIMSDGEDALWGARELNVSSEIFLALIKKIAVDKRYIEVDDNDNIETITNKLITTLLYKSNRHNWNGSLCSEIRKFIGDLKPDFAMQEKAFFDTYISHKETEENNFFGSYLSDNSDSEDEEYFGGLDEEEQTKRTAPAKLFIQRGQIEKITYQKKTGDKQKGDLKSIKSGSELFDLKSRTKIHYPLTTFPTLEAHLHLLNQKLATGISIKKAIQELEANTPNFTRFFVAEYRGITYQTTKWNQSSRKSHRKDQSEIAKPLYSNSVMAASGLRFFRCHTEALAAMESQKKSVDANAKLVHELLLTLREPKAYTYKKYSYNSLAHVLQNIYTEDYDGFHHLIKKHPVLKDLFLNDLNPFISMGDTPYHAEKYAHGIKPYKGHESFRLRPRWQANGRAERPYSGVVYASLHPLTDFTRKGPLHVVSLNRNAEIKLQDELLIVAERESCFPSYLPENRVFYKHIAKYPSFSGNYKSIYLIKYGLTEVIYNKFKEKLAHSRPHTKEMGDFKKLLGEWLCSFHEVKSIELARQEAEKRGGILIYRDVNGGFCLTPPIDSVNRNSNEMTTQIKTPVKLKQQSRASHSPGGSDIGFLNELFDDLEISSDKYGISILEKNSSLSMAFSLMLNAVSNKYHLALQHFLTKPNFNQEINKTFQCERLEHASLLHLAVLANNIRAVELLLENDTFDPNLTASETTDSDLHENRFYEELTPLHLALLEGRRNIALKLIQNERINISMRAAYVVNKDLLGDVILLPNQEYDDFGNPIRELPKDHPQYDPDDLGVAWRFRGTWPITRYRGNSALHLAVTHDWPEVINALIDRGIDIDASNPEGTTALDLALRDKKYMLAAQLIRHKASLSYSISLKCILEEIDIDSRRYILDSTKPINKMNISNELFELLMAVKEMHPQFLEFDEENEARTGFNAMSK
ncbi:ankyrin repeat domain-containing protein [Legionella drancourtii]|uniref:Uncharacterized protein n=1 Tax=Legionella drancourtii LLAP12 TaxID=658187 RepID=G9ENF9_9GAMM|nr:ankyrin repeat domain-containing protein [Legionella drancourtii]EHL31320.1 hypothetical protein LDG_6782 [Legionella drancourtii LLAP12]